MKTRLRFQVLAITAIRVVLNTMYRMVYPFLAAFGRGMGVDLNALTLALTFRSLAAAFSPFLASIGDSRGRKIGMLVGVFLFAIGAGLVAIWPTFPAFLAALVLSALGKYAFEPSMQAYIGDRVIYKRRGRVLAVTELGWSLSFILGVPLIGLLIAHWGWTAPFLVLSLMGLLGCGVLVWIIPRDPERAGGNTNMWANFRQVLTYPPACAGLGMGLLLGASNEVINLIFGVWMENSFGLVIVALGAVSTVIGMAELGGESLAAVFTDRLGKPLAVGLGLGFNSLAALTLPFAGISTAGAVVGLFFFYLTFEYAIVSSIPLMTEVLPSARATIMAVNVAAISLGRAVGAMFSTKLYIFGTTLPNIPDILPGALAAAILNFLALGALRLLQRGIQRREYTRVI